MLNHQYVVDNDTLQVNQRFSNLFRDPGGMLCHFVGMLSRNDKPPDTWATRMVFRVTFVNLIASSSSPYRHESNRWIFQRITTHITAFDE